MNTYECYNTECTTQNVQPIPYIYIQTFSYMIYAEKNMNTYECCNTEYTTQNVQPIPLGVTFSNAVSKLKAQNSNVSFH